MALDDRSAAAVSVNSGELADVVSSWLAADQQNGREAEVPAGAGDEDSDAILRSIGRLDDLLQAIDGLQHDAVLAARARGQSWTQIGAVLGISKQAAQQRFRLLPGAEVADGTRLVSADGPEEEAELLARAGREGWTLKESRADGHVLEHTDREWEIVRVSLFRWGAFPRKQDGWRAVSVRFPAAYYQRALNSISEPTDSDTRGA